MGKRAVVIVHGAAGAFKTTFAMTRQLSRQYGFPFPGFTPAPGNCIYVTGEALDRLPPLPHAWAQTFCRERSPKHYFGQVEARRGTLTSDKSFMELQSFLRSLPKKPDDIVIDHMVWLRGSGDDFDVAVVRPMIDRLAALRASLMRW
jgi:AAA domain